MIGGGRSCTAVIAVVVPIVLIATFVGVTAGIVGATEVADEPLVEGTVDGPSATDPLKNETGTTEVIVRFEPLEEREAEGDAVVDELRAHAADERNAFESFAAGNQSVSIERTFWLANALVVTVDADVVGTSDLLAVANVTRIHENVEIDTIEPNEGSDGISVVESSTPSRSSESAMTAPQVTAVESETAHTPGLELVGVPSTWERFGTRGAGSTVAVIDTGVDPGHEDIELEAWASFDGNGTLLSDDVADANDPDGHGTHVAGTVAGGAASGTHIGVAPDAALHGVDVFGEDGTATFASVLAGMQRTTADQDVDVLQMSLGASGAFGGFIAPVRNARAADKVVVVAVGNEGHGTSSSPANLYDSLAVGATRNDGRVADFSGGQSINKTAAFANPPDEWPEHYVVPDVVAPGVGVRSAEAGTTDGYVELQGTSMAAPHVGGIAALSVAATDGRIDGDGVHAAIVDTTVHPDGATEPDDRHGHGLVDAEAAVGAAVAAAPTPTATPATRSRTPATPSEVEPVASEDEAPGFGVPAAVIALVVALLGTRATGEMRR